MTTTDTHRHVRLARGRDCAGRLYTGTYRGHGLTLQRYDGRKDWHVWIKPPDADEQHGDGFPTRQAALHAAIVGIDHHLKGHDA